MGDRAIQILIVIIVVIGIGLAIYFSHMAAKKRREALRAIADQLGWSYSPSRDASHDEEYAHFEIFRRGHSRYAFNTLYGTATIGGNEHRAKMGDFEYKVTSSNGKTTTTTTYTFSYLIIHLPFRAVPDLLIRREGMLDKLAGLVGFDDIDFESSEFSKRFLVKSPDKRFAYDVIDPRMMEFLLGADPPAIDIERGRVCIADGRSRWQPPGFLHNLRFTDQFLSRWPEHVVASLESHSHR
jgi:hypothetical protein